MQVMLRRAAVAFALTTMLATTAAAQAPAAAWAPWTGCWRLMTETGFRVGDASQPTVCVAEVAGGAQLTTTLGDRPAVTQTILADGRDHAVDEAGCRGTQRHEWGPGGLRLYGQAELTCAGDAAPRHVTSYALLLQDGNWLDIQAIDIGGRDSVRVRRYRHADAAVAIQMRPGRPLDLEDVKEASIRGSVTAVEAAVVEAGTVIPLSARTLLELERARVPGRVIDLMVAVAYPDKFAVDRLSSADRGVMPPVLINDPFWFGSSGLGGGCCFFDVGSAFYDPYYYSPFAYSYYSRYNRGGWLGQPYFVGVPIGVGGGGGGGNLDPVSSGSGRVVNGRGYTQVRQRDPATDTGTATTNGVRSDRSRPASAAAATSSGSTASPSGYSGGSAASTPSSGSDGGGRTAVPR